MGSNGSIWNVKHITHVSWLAPCHIMEKVKWNHIYKEEFFFFQFFFYRMQDCDPLFPIMLLRVLSWPFINERSPWKNTPSIKEEKEWLPCKLGLTIDILLQSFGSDKDAASKIAICMAIKMPKIFETIDVASLVLS